MRYPLNQPITLSTTVKNSAGTPTDAGALTLLVKVRAADGTSTTTGTYASPAHDGTGLYHQDVPAADLQTLGHYQYTWTATGTGAGVSFGDFDVFDPFESALLPLQDAFAALNISDAASQQAAAAEVGLFVATIETSLEAMTGGPILNTSITERAEFACDMLTLQVRQRPLVSVTQIVSVPNGATVDISAGLDLDNLTGIIRTKGGWTFSAFSPVCTVTYVAGWGTQVPAAFNRAASIILQSLWSTQQGPSARPNMAGGEPVQVPGFTFLIPPLAAGILEGALNGVPFMPGEVFA